MLQQDYQKTVTAEVTRQEAFDKINDVRGWWARNFEGSSTQPGDIFTVRFGATFVTFKITEMVPDKKVVWKVIDCYLPWQNDKTEWNGTSLVFKITPVPADSLLQLATSGRAGISTGTTQVRLTHLGLVPGLECYDQCSNGWDDHFGKSFHQLLTRHEGSDLTS